MYAEMGFSEFFEDIDPVLARKMVELSLKLRPYFEAEHVPALLPQDQGFKLQFPGRHLDTRLPKAADDDHRTVWRPDVSPSVPTSQIVQQGRNFILRVSDIKNLPGLQNVPVPQVLSHFVRDQPFIAAYSQANAINMASTIIFVLMTIRADFMQVMQDFPVVMMLLMHKFQDNLSPENTAAMFQDEMFRVQAKLARYSAPEQTTHNRKGEPYRIGYGTGGTIFGWKWRGVAQVWAEREKHYGSIMNLVHGKDTVAVFEYLLQNISGLAMAKAGFCCQLIFGELGCIDMHNVNLYSQYYINRAGQDRSDKLFKSGGIKPRRRNRNQAARFPFGTGRLDTWRGPADRAPKLPADPRDIEMYKDLDPNQFAKPQNMEDDLEPGYAQGSREMESWTRRYGTFHKKVMRYINMLNELERDGFNTVKLWDIWVAYVSRFYVTASGGSRYARDGQFAGNPLDPKHDPTDKKIMDVQPDPVLGGIPDRNTVAASPEKVKWVRNDQGVLVPVMKSSGKALDTFTTQGMDKEPSAGAASLAHGATWWWRQPDYWWDMLAQAQAVANNERRRPKDIFRYASADATAWADKEGGKAYEQPSARVSKALAYLATEPELANTIFPDTKERQSFMSQLDDVLRKLEFWWKHQHYHVR